MMTKEFKTKYFNKIKDAFDNGIKGVCKTAIVSKLPKWVIFIAMDSKGDVYGYNACPVASDTYEAYMHNNPDMISTWLFSMNVDESVDWKDTLVTLEDVIDEFTDSILKFDLWEAGNATLIGNIVKTKNIPEDGKYLFTGQENWFWVGVSNDSIGLKVKDNCYETSKDIVKTFYSAEERSRHVKLMLKHIYEAFKRKIATEDDIGKEVTTYEGKTGILRAITTDGKFVVETDELRITYKAWVEVEENKIAQIVVTYPNGKTSYTFKV